MGRSAREARARPSRRRHLLGLGLLLLGGALPATGGAEELAFPNGDRYVGDVVDGRRSGEGRYEWADGRVYEGDFVRGEREGRGLMTWPDGRRYEGEFRADSIAGEGRMDFPDGGRYRGEWRDGAPHGLGTYRWPDRDRYTGEYVDGVRTGWGEFRRSDGLRYVGGYADDAREGQGTLITPDGTLYRGRFEAGVRNGAGIRVSPNGSSLTLETWSAGTLVERRAIRESTGCRLRHGKRRWMVVGTECIDGLAHGRGNAVSTDGTQYVDSGRFVLGRLVVGAPLALGQPPEEDR